MDVVNLPQSPVLAFWLVELYWQGFSAVIFKKIRRRVYQEIWIPSLAHNFDPNFKKKKIGCYRPRTVFDKNKW